MGRKRVEDGERINFYVERSDLNILKVNQSKTGVTVSQQIRFAIKNYLDLKQIPITLNIHKPSQEVVDLVHYISNIHITGESLEMKKDPMMILFSKEWFKLKQMMEMTIAVLKEKGYPDILYEEIIWNVEVPGSSRTKQFRHGFKISFGRKTSKKELAKVYEALHKELNERGRISLVDGE